MKKIPLLTALMIALTALHAQTPVRSYLEDPNIAPREHSLDFTLLKLDLSIDAPAGRVMGRVTHYFTPLRPSVDSFFLDGILMTVHSITLNGQPVRYHADSAGISVIPGQPLHWGEQDSLSISYEATPRRGLYFIGWNDPKNLSRKQIWSQGEGIDNRFWIPMYDERNDKVITDMNITFDKQYKVLSNGQLTGVKENPDGTNTWRYLISHPNAPYLTMLGIGKYDIKETHSASGTPMRLYYYPEWKDKTETTYQYSEAIIDFLEKETGLKFPWDAYAQIPVQDYMFGAMENTTATIFGDFFLVDARGALDRNYVGVNAHEAAHQWFGDYVTAKSDAHQWLQESFATYYDQLFEQSVYGQDHFDWLRRGAENAAISESLHNKSGIGHSRAAGAQMYGKGAFVLNMLKAVVGGREPYNRAIKYYLEQHPYQNVDSHDLLIAFEASTGMSLSWFWDEWIYRGEEPSYQISLDDRSDRTQLVIRQNQELSDITGFKKGLFIMPVPIEVHYKDHSVSSQTYWIRQQTEIINIPNPDHKEVAFVLFDPGNIVLKSVSFSKPFAMLAAQALEAERLLDRYDALAAMKRIPVDAKRDLLIGIYEKEKFYALRNEVLAQLSGDTTAAAIGLFQKALADKDVAVRRAALTSVNLDLTGLIPECEKLLADSSYGIIELALQKLTGYAPIRTAAWLKVTKGVTGNVGRNVQVRWLELAYACYDKASYADQLVTLTSSSYEFRTRTNAMGALRRSAYFSNTLVSNLVDAMLSANSRLSGPATDLLRFFYGQNRYRARIGAIIRSGSWTPREAGVLNEFAN